MLFILVTTLTWGLASSAAAFAISTIFYVSKKSIQGTIVVGAFVLGCIRGYTGKSLLQ